MNKSLVTESAEELTGMAERDIVNVKLLVDKKFYPEDYMYNVICFHATQAVEKLLKSYIISNGKTIEKIHDLDILQKTAMEIDNSFSKIMDTCLVLNEYAPKIKYSTRNQVTKQNISDIIKSLDAICNFPPIKNIRDSFSKKHNYEIITEVTTDPVKPNAGKARENS
jgi:HEPN domain-containing protein